MRKQLFLSLAPNAVSEGGHDVVYQRCLEKAARDMGCSYLGLFPKKTKLDRLQKNWVPFFQSKKYGRVFDYFKLLWIRRRKIIFIESFGVMDFAFLALSFLLFSRKEDLLMLMFRYGADQLRFAKFRIFLTKLCRSQLAIFTDSELIAKDYSERWNIQLILLPIPHTEGIMNRVNSRDKIICWWPGPPKKAKGFDDILRLASLPNRDRAKIEMVAAEMSCLPNTKLISNFLKREEYLFWLKECDFVLLPYDPIVYRFGTSGIFVEAIIAGKIPLVKEGSWLAAELLKFGLTELIVDWQDPDFFSHLLQLLNSQQVQEKRKGMQEAYKRFHSQDKFTEILRRTIPCEALK